MTIDAKIGRFYQSKFDSTILVLVFKIKSIDVFLYRFDINKIENYSEYIFEYSFIELK